MSPVEKHMRLALDSLIKRIHILFNTKVSTEMCLRYNTRAIFEKGNGLLSSCSTRFLPSEL